MGDVVTTSADALLDLVQRRKSISLDDAAKELGLPKKVAESLANFLEEERLMKIKYSFTKAFLVPFPVEKTKKMSEEVVIERRAVVESAVMPEHEHVEFSPADLAQVDMLFQRATAALAKGDFELAKEIYLQMKQQFDVLPVEYEEKRQKLLNDLLNINEQWASSLEVLSESITVQTQKQIQELMQLVQSALQKKDFNAAGRDFARVRELFGKIPAGMLEQKVVLEKDIIALQIRLLQEKFAADTRQLAQVKRDIDGLLEVLRNALNQGKLDEAQQVYDSIVKKKEQVPLGFTAQKAVIDSKILQAYAVLTSRTLQQSEGEIKLKSKKISSLLQEVQQLLDLHQVKQALMLYNQAKKIFESLPHGFWEMRVQLHEHMLETAQVVLDRFVTEARNDMRLKATQVVELWEKAEKAVSGKEVERARKEYQAVLKVFQSLPVGFVDEKTKLKLRIIQLYKKLIA